MKTVTSSQCVSATNSKNLKILKVVYLKVVVTRAFRHSKFEYIRRLSIETLLVAYVRSTWVERGESRQPNLGWRICFRQTTFVS